MGLVDLFFSVRGRINRAQYWLGSAIITAIFFGGIIIAISAASGAAENAPKGESGMAGAGMFALILLPLAVLTCWTGIAIQIKRFHDRGRPWWLILLPFVPAIFVGMAVGEMIARGGSPYELAASLQPYSAIGMLINLYLFIELGCLPGVDGDNKYGPPPGSARGPLEPTHPSGAVDAASALFGAQSAIDRAIANAGKPQPELKQPAAAPAFAGASRTTLPSATPSFGRRISR